MAVPTKLSRFTINVPEQLARAVEDLARDDERSVSKYLAIVIQRHVDQVRAEGAQSSPSEAAERK